VEKIWRYLPLTRSSQVCHQKIFLSLLHSIGIQLIPVEFRVRPHQWCQAAGAPLRHFHQWMMGRCLQILTKMPSRPPVPIKISTSSLVPTCACVSLLQLRIRSVTKQGFEERAATVFEKKVAKVFHSVGNQLFNKLNISRIFLLLFSPNASEND